MNQLKLTADQQDAYVAIAAFLTDPDEKVFVLSGYSGTGKSTLVIHVIQEMKKLAKLHRIINPDSEPQQLILTATTNKAAESLAYITGQEVRTIQSTLGLRVHTNFKTGNSSLVPTNNRDLSALQNAVLVVDEFSYVDPNLLSHITNATIQNDCKVLYVGDPAQITPIKSSTVPVLDANFPTAYLSEVVRQADGNPIIELSTKFRHMVNTGKNFQFTPDGVHIRHAANQEFEQEVIKEFTDPTWHNRKSKLLAWTNKAVINYNQGINNLVKGTPKFSAGDYAVCNSYINTKTCRFKTDQTVFITHIDPGTEYGLSGNHFTFEGVPLHLCLTHWMRRKSFSVN